MKQNLFWTSFYNILAIPIAAGILYPNFGIILRPEISALLMSASSIIVATNAVLLKRTEKIWSPSRQSPPNSQDEGPSRFMLGRLADRGVKMKRTTLN